MTNKDGVSITNPMTNKTKEILVSEKSSYLSKGWGIILGFGPNKNIPKVTMIDPLGKEVTVRKDNIEKYKIQGYKLK